MKNNQSIQAWGFLFALLLMSALCVQKTVAQGSEGMPQKANEELTQRINTILASTRVPGAVVTIVDGPDQVWSHTFGYASLESRQSVTPDTLFRIGSISKILAALAVMKLEQEGRLDIQAPIKTLVPEVTFSNRWEDQHPVRVIHLLEHTTGWDDLSLRDYASNDPSPLTLDQGLELTARSRVSRWVPGTQHAYCNIGSAVAAAIVEKISGERFEDYVTKHLFGPLGMKTATYFEPAQQLPHSETYHSDGKTAYPYHHLILRPAGSINASAGDMSALLNFFIKRGAVGGAEVLPTGAISAMEAPESSEGARAGLAVGYAKDIAVGESNGFMWRGHAGGVDGAVSDFGYLREGRGYFFAVSGGQGGRAAAQLRDAIRAHLTKGLDSTEQPASLPPTEAVSAAASGWYRPTNSRLKATDFLWHLLIARVDFNQSQMIISPLLGAKQNFVQIRNSLFRRADQSFASVALMTQPSGGALQIQTESFERISTATAWIEVSVLVLTVVFVVSGIFIAVFWLPIMAFRRKLTRDAILIRSLPLIAALCLLGLVCVFAFAGDDLPASFGRLSAYSASLFVLSIAFPVLALSGLLIGIKKRHAAIGRFSYWYSVLASVVFFVVGLYFAFGGVFGYRSWI